MSYPNKFAISNSMQNTVCYKALPLIGGSIIRNSLNRPSSFAGGFSSVFPFMIPGGKKIAIKIWSSDIGKVEARMNAITLFLEKIDSHYFIKTQFIENALLVDGKIYPILSMEWIDSRDLKQAIEFFINDKEMILKIASNFKILIKFLHENSIAHGDLSHTNITVDEEGNIKLLDYDSMYIKELDGYPDIVKGLSGYQHPKRNENTLINNKLDYFSELVIYVSLIAIADHPEIWPEYFDTEFLLFSHIDYNDILVSALFNKLILSENEHLIYLLNYMKIFLENDDILNLLPLEEIIENENFNIIAKKISNKF